MSILFAEVINDSGYESLKFNFCCFPFGLTIVVGLPTGFVPLSSSSNVAMSDSSMTSPFLVFLDILLALGEQN